MAGVNCKIDKGKIVVNKDSTIVKKGDVVTEQAAAPLSKLGIKPVDIGLKLNAVYEDGVIYTPEVLDIDETAYRQGRLVASLQGYLRVPVIPDLIQSSKGTTGNTTDEQANKQGIAKSIVDEWDPSTLYLLGPGTTIDEVALMLGIDHTLLGVDIVKGSQVLVKDANEAQILQQIKTHTGPILLLISPIGQQGFILGRGNQQISPRVLAHISKDNVRVLATRAKIRNLTVLHVDTGDPAIDQKFTGYLRVLVDYREERLLPVK